MRPFGRRRTLPLGSTRPASLRRPVFRLALHRKIEWRLDQISCSDRVRPILAEAGDPPRPQPVRRIHARHIETRGDAVALLGDTPQHRVDKLVVALGARVVLRKPNREIDRRMRRRLEEDKLGRARQENGIELTRLLGQPTLEEYAEHMIDLSTSSQARGHDGAGERPVALRQIEHPASRE